jgi:hypothetical protein
VPFPISLVLFALPVPREEKTTVLLPVQAGNVWRVQIIWPNGTVHYFGSFASRNSAVEWIAAHAFLTVRPKPPSDPPA